MSSSRTWPTEVCGGIQYSGTLIVVCVGVCAARLLFDDCCVGAVLADLDVSGRVRRNPLLPLRAVLLCSL